jgi:hypothetical protein
VHYVHYVHYMHSGALGSGATALLPFTKPLDSTASPSVPSVNNGVALVAGRPAAVGLPYA